MLGEKSLDEMRCIKRELKSWESMFERKHARKPNKDDVNNAPEEIRETYLKYNQLKRGSKDIKKIDTQPKDEEEKEDDVFGKSLNKNSTPVSTNNKPVRIKVSPTKYKPIKLCHGQRQKTPKLKSNFMESSEQDVKKNEDQMENVLAVTKDSNFSSELGFSISSTKKDALNMPGMMLGKSTLAKRMKRRSALAGDWLEKNQSELANSSINEVPSVPNMSNDGKDIQDVNNSAQDVYGEFESGDDVASRNKKLPKSNGGNVSPDENLIETDCQTGFQGKSTVDRKLVRNCGVQETTGVVTQKQAFEEPTECGKHTVSSNPVITDNIAEYNEGTGLTRSTTKTQNIENGSATLSLTGNPDCVAMSENNRSKNIDKTSAAKRKRASSVEPSSARAIIIPACENTDLLVTSENTGSQNTDNSTSTKRKRTKSVEQSFTSEDVKSFCGDDLQDRPSKMRKTYDSVHGEVDMKEVESVDNGKEEDGEKSDESGEEYSEPCGTSQTSGGKRSSGLVSQNFRALNMKVRRYSRGPRSTNYAAYKRKMWKQKQQANEQGDAKKSDHWKKRKSSNNSGNRRITGSTTNTTCFKCGEDGHWAKDCPRNKPSRAQVPAENWSEPVNAPADLEIGNEQWQATEEKLKCLVSDRLPRLPDAPCQAPPAIEPLYQPENDRPINTPREVYDALNKLGFDSFRCGQEKSIMQILSGLSTLVVLSTGAGKSLCYQLPAYMYSRRSPCITLVISPLVSLMEDQVVGLPFGLDGVSLNTNMTKQQRQKAVEKICSGKAAVVLVSPEALVGGNSGAGCLPHPTKLPPIAFACIDEAHCVSEWSHNFRPSYLRVCKVLRERFGVRCFLGLTATATRSTALSVCEHLGIIHRPEGIVRGATVPDNLNLSVSCDLNKDRAILELLQGSRFSDCDSIIIYCTRREQTERLATYLRTCLQKNPMNTSSSITDQNEADEMEQENKEKKRGKKRKSETAKSKSGKKALSWHAECYHAGLSAAQRKKVQKKFMAGELRIVVATVAFGMGLDKADVRAVIHYNMPKSFESYVQEIGRAGRDGLPSHCHVFVDPEGKDVRELRRHAHASTVDRNTIKKLVQQIFPTCDCRTLHANMKEKRDRELNAGSTAGCSNEGVNQASEQFDWLDGDDDVIGHLVEFESQSAVQEKKELGISREDVVKTGTREIAPKAGVNSKQEANYVTKGDDVSHDVTGSDDVVNNDVTKNGDDVTGDDVANNDNITGDDVINGGDVINSDESTSMDHQTEDGELHSNAALNRICGGHEVAIPIERAVQSLDMKEEAIETLLCYLELHAKNWAEILKSIRSTCSLKFYGGPAHLHYVAQRVPIVTAAVAYARRRGEFKRKTSSLTFPIVEIVDEMDWDLEPVRRELYGLQWNEGLRLPNETGLSAGHSGIIVEFADFAFHVRAPGDLSGDERDEVCDFLEDRVMAQERSQVAQLHNVWSTFNTRAHPNCWQSAEECDKKVDGDLKCVVKAYFESKNDGTKTELEALSTARKKSEFIQSVVPAELDEPVNWDAVSRDVRSFITSHDDLELSGRAIARVFHGIDSPCFPASVWGRERRYWRRHLDVDFNLLRKCATKELVKFR